MIFYIVFAILLFLLSLFNTERALIVAISLLFVFNIYRDYSIGTDYGRNYKRIYEQTNMYNLESDLKIDFNEKSDLINNKNEVGWSLITFISKQLDLPFACVNFITAVIIFSFLFFIIKQSPLPVFSLLLYLLLFRYFASFNILRQSISITIILYAVKFIVDRKLVKYLFFCIIASLFHASSIILIFVYFISYLKLNLKLSYVLIAISFIIPIFHLDTLFFQLFYEIDYLSYYMKYFNIEYEFKRYVIIYYIPNIILTIIFIYLHQKSKSSTLSVYSKLWFFAILITNLTINYYALFRINELFITSVIIGIPLMINRENLYIMQKQMIFVFSLLMIYYVEYLLGDLNSVVPYKFIFKNLFI